jgi:hypothetical protein
MGREFNPIVSGGTWYCRDIVILNELYEKGTSVKVQGNPYGKERKRWKSKN